MDEHDDWGSKMRLLEALTTVAMTIDGMTPLDIARVVADGPATADDADAFLNSARLTARLRSAWNDRCPPPDLLARSLVRASDPEDRRLMAGKLTELLSLHIPGCPRCIALLAVLASDQEPPGLLEGGRDWLGPFRPLSGTSPEGVVVTALNGRLLVRADSALAGGVAYVTVTGTAPEIRQAFLRLKGSRARADLPLPAEPGALYVDIAVQRRTMDQPILQVALRVGLAAAGAGMSTMDRERLDDVTLTAPDGRTARLRVKAGTGHSGSAVEVRLLADQPGGVWTADGRRLKPGQNVLIESPPRPLTEALGELRFGAVSEGDDVH